MKSALCGIAVFVLTLVTGCCSTTARDAHGGFIALAEAVPDAILEPRY